MKISLRFVSVLLFALTVSLPLLAQGSDAQMARFSDGGVTFDYPAKWTLTDKSTADNQHLVLELKGTSAQIMVLVERTSSTQPGQRTTVLRAKTAAFADYMADELKKLNTTVERSEVTTEAGGVVAEGIRLRAAPGNQPGSIEVYSLVLGGRVVMLTLLGPDADAQAAAPAWASVRRSLRVSASSATNTVAPSTNTLVATQRPAKFAGFDYGKVSGSSYANNFFGLHLTIPYGWRVEGQAVKDMLAEKGRSLVKTDNAQTNAQIDASVSNTVNLLTVFKYEIGASVDFNASLICGAEWLENPSMSSSQYMANAKRILEMSQKTYEIKPFTKEMVGGEEFAVMEVTMESSVKQKYYASIKKGYALFFILTYAADEDEAILRQALRSVRFS